jgi:hypothetical protein
MHDAFDEALQLLRGTGSEVAGGVIEAEPT